MIHGQKIALRALELADASLLQQWMNDPEVARWLGRQGQLTLAEEERWLQAERPEDLRLGIVTLDGKLIGSCGFSPLNSSHACASLGISIGEKDYWNGGYGTDALLTLCGYGFGYYNLHRLQLCVFARNARAIRCYEKCGFIHEGCSREAFYRHGAWQDMLHMGLLRTEYVAKWPQRWATVLAEGGVEQDYSIPAANSGSAR